MKIALRCLLVEQYEKNEENTLSQVEYALNTTKNAFTITTSFKLLYDVTSRESLSRLQSFSHNNAIAMKFIANRQSLRNEVYDTIKFAQTRMTILYDSKHRELDLHDNVYIKMIKIEEIDYQLLTKSSNLSVKKIELFVIKRKVDNLAYELKLSSHMKIHNVISIKHLKQVNSDALRRDVSISSSIKHKEEKLYVIEKIVRRGIKDDESKYIIK